MNNLNFNKSQIERALKLSRIFELLGPAKKVLFVLALISLFIFFYGFFLGELGNETNRKLLGFFLLAVSMWILLLLKEAFLKYKIKSFNSENLSYEVFRAISKAKNSARSPEITTTQLLYFALKDNPKLKHIFTRLLVDFEGFKKLVREKIKSYPVIKEGDPVVSETFDKVIAKSLEIALSNGHGKVEIGDLVFALAQEDIFFKEMLMEKGLKAEDFEELALWQETLEEKDKKRKAFWLYENLAKKGTLAKTWTSGFTLNLDKYSMDITEQVGFSDMEFVGHENELKAIERILSIKGTNNVLLVGNPGTGRKSIIYHLAKRSLLGMALEDINHKRVVELDVSSLLIQIESMEEVEVVLGKIFQEATTAGNIILVLDNIHDYIGRINGLGVMDISGIISPYLRYQDFRVIGIADYEGLHKNMEKNSNILSLFEKVEVSEISIKETIRLLQFLAFSLESEYEIFISYPALREIVSLADRYFPALSFPEKASDLLKEICVYVSSINERVVLPKHVSKIVSQKTEIPVGEIESKEKEILLKMEDLIHERIINQEEAVREVSCALRRSRSEITVRKGPMGAFLFLGPTGVGKTETSKALAEIYFGAEKRMIRMDMSEFQNSADISRLIGSASEQGLLTDQVRENPFSLILLDEIEKTHPNILNLFLQVFDEGHLTDGLGRKVDFKNTIIIATSNAGYEIILKALKNNEKWEGVRQRMVDYLFEEKIFRPEFLNRFDAFVVFMPLSEQNLFDIAGLLLGKLRKNLQNKGIELDITEDLKREIARLGYNPVFGAREMRRVIQEKVENPLSEAFLSGKIRRGSKVGISSKDFSLINK